MASDPSSPIGILPHHDFVNSIASADYHGHIADPRSRVIDEASFKEMQAYLMHYYQGVQAQHSFADDAGQVFDCIPINQQPSLKGTHRNPATPPDLSGLSSSSRSEAPATGPFAIGRKDRHGNPMGCPAGTIPVRRITMEQLARSSTLRDFLSKHERTFRPVKSTAPANVSDGHLYATAVQEVGNIGAHSFLNLSAPTVAENQVFSLSQHWYVAGSYSDGSLQTAEVGWQVYPQLWGTAQPVLFVYWTPDAYQTGAYNLSQAGQPGFVQINPAWGLGQSLPLAPTSSPGGVNTKSKSWYISIRAIGGSTWAVPAPATPSAIGRRRSTTAEG